MNDYHLDPPDEPDPPSCPVDGCDGYAEDMTCRDGFLTYKCDSCLGTWTEPEPQEFGPGPMDDFELPDDLYAGPAKCPHDREWHDCSACDHAGDIAYDAWREST